MQPTVQCNKSLDKMALYAGWVLDFIELLRQKIQESYWIMYIVMSFSFFFSNCGNNGKAATQACRPSLIRKNLMVGFGILLFLIIGIMPLPVNKAEIIILKYPNRSIGSGLNSLSSRISRLTCPEQCPIWFALLAHRCIPSDKHTMRRSHILLNLKTPAFCGLFH